MRKIQSILMVVGGLAALAGCQGMGAPGGMAQPSTPIQVSYAGNGAIEVVSTDRLAISQVEVVGPSGPIASTMSVHRETIDPYAGAPYAGQYASAPPPISPFFGVGMGVGRWSGSTRTGSGVFLGVPPFGGYGHRGLYGAPGPYSGYGSAPPPSGGPMRSTARVTFDDPAAYERQWRGATVRVRLGNVPDGPVTELPAPAPSR